MSSGCEKFHRSSKAFQRCHESNAFREMHGLSRIEGLEDAPLVIEPSQSIQQKLSTPQVVRREPSTVKRGCGSCGGGRKSASSVSSEASNSFPAVKPIPKFRTRNDKKSVSAIRKNMSLVDRAKQYAEALARHLADDKSATLIEDKVFRMNCCNDCSFNVNDTCSLCECPLKKNLLNDGKLSWRSEQCPVGRWFRQTANRRPLVNPTRNLIFHLYPKRGAEWNWHWHIARIRESAGLFNGEIVIGVVVGPETETIDEVMRVFDGVPVTDWVVKENSKLAETLTFIDMMKIVKTDDPNTVTLRMHTKGVTKRPESIEQSWKELLWESCLDWPSVNDALASHLVCGPLRSQEPLVKRASRGNFFFAGSAYWFRNREAFEREWDHTEPNRWWVEYVPGHLFALAESECLLHDFTASSVLSETYWRETIEPEWNNWRRARGLENADTDLD